MKKIILAAVLGIVAVKTFAAESTVYNLVSNSDSSQSLCASEISISKSKDMVVISGASDLGAYFNLDSAEGDVVIKSINKEVLKNTSRNNSHGTMATTKTKATLKDDVLVLNTTTSFGRFIPSKADNTLTVDFREDGVIVEIERSYDEAFSSSSDWETYQKCEYSL